MNESIANKIKTLREEANLSLEEMAQNTGISISQLELMESGEVSPNKSILMKIANLFGVRLGTILDGEEESGPIVSLAKERVATVSGSNFNPELCEHLHYFSLASNKKDRSMEPLIVLVEHLDDNSDKSKHEGEEFIYVLEGEADIIYGTERYSLKQGDSIYYDSIVPHIITTPTPSQKAKIIAVTYTPS